jgi:hypothetical protein
LALTSPSVFRQKYIAIVLSPGVRATIRPVGGVPAGGAEMKYSRSCPANSREPKLCVRQHQGQKQPFRFKFKKPFHFKGSMTRGISLDGLIRSRERMF